MSLRKHTAYNLIGAALPMGLSLITIPIYLGIIGEARYGILAVAWLLVGYFGLFDLGLGRATAQRVASNSVQSSGELALIVRTALAMNAGFGIVGGLVIWPVAVYFFGHFFKVDATLVPELTASIPWLSLAVPLAAVSGVLTGALQGQARFFELNIASVLSAVLIQLLPLIVAWLHGPDLAYIVPSIMGARVLTLIWLFVRCRSQVFKAGAAILSWMHAKNLLQFGGWVTVTAIVGPIMVIFDRFVIGTVLGPAAVTHYTVPFQLAERTTILPNSFVQALFPRLAGVEGIDARQLAGMALRSLAAALTPVMLIGVLLVRFFMGWWISPEFAAHAGLTAEILLIGFWINGFANVPFAQLQASGRPNIVAKCHLVEVVPYILLLYVGLHLWGLPGAALIFSLRTLADWVLLTWFSGNLRSGFGIIKLPVLILISGVGVASNIMLGSVAWWLSVMCLLSGSLVWSWREAPSDLRRYLVGIGLKVSVSKPGAAS